MWDLLPEGKKIGGAPANFIYNISALGHKGIIASRIGEDKLGKKILQYFIDLKISTEYIQIDNENPTGTVNVIVDESGNPKYTIKKNVAWDFLEFEKKWKHLAKEVDAVYFGSLSQRSEKSYFTVKKFLKHAKEGTVIIFDANLRQNFYSAEIIAESLQASLILKINDTELSTLQYLFGYKNNNLEEFCDFLININ